MELTQRIPQYGVNTLKDTPLWNIIQEQTNNTNLEWKDGGILDLSLIHISEPTRPY